MDYIHFGGGYLAKKFNLTSIYGFLFSFILLFITMIITIVLYVFHNQVNIFALILIWPFLLFSLLGIIACFLNTIKVDLKRHELTIFNLKKKVIDIDNLQDIYIKTDNSIDNKKFCNIVFVLKNNEKYSISGYSSILKNNNVEKTKNIIKNIKQLINLN